MKYFGTGYVPVPYMTTAMPSVMYPPMMYRPYMVPETMPTTTPLNVMPQPPCPPAPVPPTTTANSFDIKRSASRATSVKGEPGSTMAMSESSKKVMYYK